jgi:hypothetical protein
MLHWYLLCIRAALRETGKGHVSTDVTPGIRMMYRSHWFAAKDNIMISEVTTALRTEDKTESSGM